MSDAEIKLYGFVGHAGMPDLSPFVAKLEAYLRLAEVPYEKCLGDSRKAPRGKLPYISHGGRKITDSQRIIEYLAEQGIADLDGWLDADQRAELFALRSMLEADFYFVIVYFRWQTETGWARFQKEIAEVLRLAGIPAFLHGFVLRSIRKGSIAQLLGQGAGRRDSDENLAHATQMFAALERFVARSEGPWWFGDKPSSADAIAWAFVAGAIKPKFGLPLETLAEPHPRLRAWFEHVDAKVTAAAS